MFDSGVGGLCVLRRCALKMPNERFIYIADKANMPYGERTVADIKRAALSICDALIAMNCKAIVVACNTATENAVEEMRRYYPTVPIIGLEPAVKPCYRELGRGYAVALVTPATEKSPKFKRLMCAYGDKIVSSPQAGLAEMIENNVDDIRSLRSHIYGILTPYKDAEAVSLGCSHYTYIAPIISDFYDGKIKIYDGADGAADRLLYCLSIAGINAPKDNAGSVRFYSTVPKRK